MLSTPCDLKAASELLAAYVAGESLEFCAEGCWTTSPLINPEVLVRSPELYRIKPKTSYRSWTPQEIPVGAVVKHKSGEYVTIITGTEHCRIMLGLGGVTHAKLHRDYVWKWPQETEWRTCGVPNEQS